MAREEEAEEAETNCGKEVVEEATTVEVIEEREEEEGSKDHDTRATHTPAKQGPSHQSPNFKKVIQDHTCGKIDHSLGSVVKGNKLFKPSTPNPTTNLKSDHIIDNSKGNQDDENNRDNSQGNLEINPNHNAEKTSQREKNLSTKNIGNEKTATPIVG